MKIKKIVNPTISVPLGIVILIIVLVFSSVHHHSQKNMPDVNVIILTLSGVRNSESIDDPTHQYIPNLWNELRPQGTLYTNVLDLNYQFHMPTIHAINTGLPQPFHTNVSDPESFFQFIRRAYKLPRHKLWMIGLFLRPDYDTKTEKRLSKVSPSYFTMLLEYSKEFAALLTESDKEFAKRYNKVAHRFTLWPHWDSFSKFQWHIFRKVLRVYKPRAVHYVLNDVDVGHHGTYAKCLHALVESDAHIKEVYDYINTDEAYSGKTYLFVTPDQSRDAYYMDHSENKLGNPPSTWLYVYGPGIKKNTVLNSEVNHIDIFATVMRIFNLEHPSGRGEVLEDCFIKEKRELLDV